MPDIVIPSLSSDPIDYDPLAQPPTSHAYLASAPMTAATSLDVPYDGPMSPISAPMLSPGSSSSADSYHPPEPKEGIRPIKYSGGDSTPKRRSAGLSRRPKKRTPAAALALDAETPSRRMAFDLNLPSELKSILIMDWKALVCQAQVRSLSFDLSISSQADSEKVAPLPRYITVKQTLADYLAETNEGKWEADEECVRSARLGDTAHGLA